jgi:3-phenylpropionate/trans-cinnamate dioxygenase ferredoxin subunit
MALTSVASTADLQPNKMKAVNVNGKPVLLVNLEGTFYAIGNVCTHMACSLSNGRLKGEVVQCPCHGSMFNVKTGSVVGGPALKPEPKYNVKVENGQVMIGT